MDEIKIIKEEQAFEETQPTNNNIPSCEYDVLYENQRGLFILGVPKFSSKALTPADPPPWTNKNQKFSPMDIHTFQLPNPSWEWVHEEWMIEMSGDVDEEGWEYAFDFHCTNWHGHYKLFRSFVRRRCWIRLRRLKIIEIEETPTNKDDPSGAIENNLEKSEIENLWHNFKTSKSDREKIAIVKEFIINGGDLTCLDQRLNEFVEVFDHQESRRIFLELLLMYGTNRVSINSPALLDFSSDVKEMLEHVKATLDTRYPTKGGNTELTSN